MRLLPLSPVACAGLAACGGPAAGPGIEVNAVLAEVDPIFATDPSGGTPGNPLDDSLTSGTGASGIMAVQGGGDAAPTLVPIKLSMNADRSILTVEIDGVAQDIPAFLAPIPSVETSQLAGFCLNFVISLDTPNTNPSAAIVYDGSLGSLSYSKPNGDLTFTTGSGIFGIETPLDRLPAEAEYTGSITLAQPSGGSFDPTYGSFSGTYTMTIDFDGNDITGTSAASMVADIGAGSEALSLTGVITGITADGGLSGDIVFSTDGTDIVDVDFAGRTYGWDAESIGGAALGTFLPNGGGLIGTFGDGDIALSGPS